MRFQPYEKFVTIMGGKHTLPRCQALTKNQTQCRHAASSTSCYCTAHHDFASSGVDIDAVHRAKGWQTMLDHAQGKYAQKPLSQYEISAVHVLQ